MAKILFIVPSFTAAGGMDRMVAMLSKLLQDEHEVHVCSFDEAGARPHFPLSALFHPLGASSRLPLALRWLTYRKQAKQLRRLKDKLKIDVSISNLWRADLVSILSGGADRKISIAHANVAGSPVNRLMVQARWLVAQVYNRFDRIVAVAAPLAAALTELYRLDPKVVGTIHNFVEKVPGPKHERENACRTLFWCGRLIHEKNPLALIPIFERLHAGDPTLRLVVIGDGPQLQMMRDAAEQAGLTNGDDPPIRWTGILPSPQDYFGGGAMLLLTSYSEGLPLVILEAFVQSLPVAASDAAGGGVHEVLEARTPHDPDRSFPEITSCGILLPIPVPGSPAVDIWANHLGKLLSDEQGLLSLRTGAHERANQFTPEVASRKWHTLIDEVLA